MSGDVVWQDMINRLESVLREIDAILKDWENSEKPSELESEAQLILNVRKKLLEWKERYAANGYDEDALRELIAILDEWERARP